MTEADRARRVLCVALDVPRPDAAALARLVAASAGWVKVGLWLFTAGGPAAAKEIAGGGLALFLDLKLHDIPNTVEAAAREAAALGATLLTVHASGGEAMVRAAVRGAAEGTRLRGGAPARVVAVTVLTSLGPDDLAAIGLVGPTDDAVARLAALAQRSGAAGVVCSPKEATAVRAAWPDAFVVTPGIRPAGAGRGDQVRVETPAAAVRAGADLLVVGRPIVEAADPAAAARAIHGEIADALDAGRPPA